MCIGACTLYMSNCIIIHVICMFLIVPSGITYCYFDFIALGFLLWDKVLGQLQLDYILFLIKPEVSVV